MASAPILRTSELMLADYVLAHNGKPKLQEVTNVCQKLCNLLFENVRMALENRVSSRRCAINAVFGESSDLIDIIQELFFEKYGLKIKLEPDSTGNYHCEFAFSESDAGKIFFHASNKAFDRFRSQVKEQKEIPPYQRPNLSYVCEKTVTPPIKIDQPPKGIEFYARGTTCYSWNAEGMCDYGWGCAWRSIQTCLSSYGITILFRDLFHRFGSLEALKTIYHNKYPNEILKSAKAFAPHDTSNGWAEPFIGEMVMHFFEIPADLETLNRIPQDCNAPQEVFHRPPMTFGQFKERLERHFKRENAAPVMLDDASSSFTIVGIGSQEANLTLWIADPYIKEGVDRIQKGNTHVGLYTVTLDSHGKQIRCSLSEEDKGQVYSMHYGVLSSMALKFHEKPWMILFPK